MAKRANKKDRKSYSNTAINNLNTLFYSKVDNVWSDSGLADFFTKIEPIQTALAEKIEKLIPKNFIRVKELGSGADLTRWEIISKLKLKKIWQVTLTDFSDKSIPSVKTLSESKNFHFRSEKYNLLNPTPRLVKKNRYDAILATYVFDSIWFPEDFHYEKIKNTWHKTTYKLDVSKSYPKRNLLLKALENPSSIKSMQIDQFQYIYIKKKKAIVDINNLPYGGIISKYYAKKSKVSLNFPGGLIKKVIEAFEKQISPDGAFIIGDMAVNSKKGFTPKDSPNDKVIYMTDYLTSGKVAKFKVEDYGLAAIILKLKGFDVGLETVEDFIKNSGYEIPIKVRDHWIMTIRKV